MTQIELLMTAHQLVLRSKVCPESNPKEIMKTLLYAHQKGWLYVSFDENKKMDVVAIAYKVPEDWDFDQMPVEETGNTLYVPLLASFSRDKNKVNRLRRFRFDQDPSLEKIVFYERNSEKRKEFKIKGGEIDVKEEDPVDTRCSGVPEGSPVPAGD